MRLRAETSVAILLHFQQQRRYRRRNGNLPPVPSCPTAPRADGAAAAVAIYELQALPLTLTLFNSDLAVYWIENGETKTLVSPRDVSATDRDCRKPLPRPSQGLSVRACG